MLMNILRKFAVFIACTLLPLALISFGVLFSLHQVLGSPNHIENALDQSGIYSSVAANIVQQATSNSGQNLDASGQQAVQNAVSSAISPGYVKSQTNNALQGIYDWLQGKSNSLSFSIDLSSVKGRLADTMAQQAEQRAAALPACSLQQLQGMDPNNIDPLTVSCLPPGVTPAQVGAQARQQVVSSDFYKTGKLTPSNLNQNGKSLQQQLQPVANNYKRVSQAMTWSGVAAVLLTAGAILLSKPWQRGTKRAARIYLSIGITSAVLAFAASWVLNTVSDKLAAHNGANAEIQGKIVKVIQLLTSDLRNWWLWYGIALAVMGIAGLVAIRFIKVTQSSQNIMAGQVPEPISAHTFNDDEHNNSNPPTVQPPEGPVIS